MTESLLPQGVDLRSATESFYAELRGNFLAFVLYMFGQVEGGPLDPAQHIVEIAEALSDVAAGRCSRLILSHPPRHGKSTMASVYWVAWMLGNNPDLRFAVASYGMDLSIDVSKQCRKVVQHPSFQAIFPGVRLADDSNSVEVWGIEGRRGKFKATSVGGSLTGFGANYLLLDDPHKGFDEAKSESARDEVWSWFTGDGTSRLEPWKGVEPAIVLIHTRFHPDDCIGRVLRRQEEAASAPEHDQDAKLVDRYRVVVRPAIDADGRPLWRRLEVYLRIRANTDPFKWSALYQCDPMVSEGDFFKAEWFANPPTVAPKFVRKFRHWDLAIAQRKRSDSTSSALVGVDDDGNIWILNVTREKLSFPETKARIKQVAAHDGPDTIISIPDDILGKAIFQELKTSFLGRAAFPLNEKKAGSKENRAAIWQSKGAMGMLRMLKSRWNAEFLKEVLAFPNAAHDDMVDAVSGAVIMASQFAGGLQQERKIYDPNSYGFYSRLKQMVEEDSWEREEQRAAA